MGSLGEDIRVGVKEKKERRLSALSKLIRSKDGKNSSAALEYEHDVKTKEKEKEKDKKKKDKKGNNKKDEAQPRGEESDGSAEEADKRRRSNSKTYKGSPAAPASPSVEPASKKGDTNNNNDKSVLQSSGSIRTRHTTSTPNLQVPQPVETRPRASSTAVHRGTYTTYFFFLAQSLTYKKKYV